MARRKVTSRKVIDSLSAPEAARALAWRTYFRMRATTPGLPAPVAHAEGNKVVLTWRLPDRREFLLVFGGFIPGGVGGALYRGKNMLRLVTAEEGARAVARTG